MKVSAVIPTYNRRAYIFRAIDSVLAQTPPVDEIIVVDDGSTDGTAEAITTRYGLKVKVVPQNNMGVSVARKTGVTHAQGEWIAFLDSDDEWLAGRNATFLKAAEAVPQNVALIFGNTQFVTDEGNVVTVFEKNRWTFGSAIQILDRPLEDIDWRSGRPCTLQSSFIRRSALVTIGSFSEGLRHSEDFLAGMQLASRYSFAAIPSLVTNLHRTSDLNEHSLEPTWRVREAQRGPRC